MARTAGSISTRLSRKACLSIDPVQILQHDEERLHLALAHDEPLDRVESKLAPLKRLEPLPLPIVDLDVQKPEEGWHHALEGVVERDQLTDDLLADPPLIVAVLDLEIRLQEIDDGQIERGLAIGDRCAVDAQPAMRAMRAHNLPDEA